MKLLNKKRSNKGSVLTLSLIIFTMASLVLSMGVISPIISHIKNVRGTYYSKQAFFTAESLQEDILFRLKNRMAVSTQEILVIGNSTAEAVVTSGNNTKTITLSSNNENYVRKMKAVFTPGDGASFSYGVQAGQGGFDLGNGTVINGSVYSNGDIVGNGNADITGSAFSATVPNPTPDQSNQGSLTDIPQTIVFGGNSDPRDFAQSFVMSTGTPLTSLRLYLKKENTFSLNNAVVYIVTDDNGSPSKTSIGSTNLSADRVGTSFSYIDLPFNELINLNENTTYWLVVSSQSGTFQNKYILAATTGNNYSSGLTKLGTWSSSNGGTWSSGAEGLDAYFDLYVTGKLGLINNVDVGTGGQGDAWANTITGTDVEGTIYCKIGTSNNKSCDSSKPDPLSVAFPITDGNISDWKNSALEGGVISSVSIANKSTRTLGPVKINGNLEVAGDLYISGYIWVTGTVNVSGNVRLSDSNKSVVIIADGDVDITSNAKFSGSSENKTYILMLTTSNSATAIGVAGNAGAVILNAQNGTIRFVGNSGAKQATANRIEMLGNATLTYEEGLIDVNFVGGPSGSWVIDSWEEFVQ